VGVDVEERSRKVDYLGLAERYFASDEARYLTTLPEEQRGDAFFAIWTLKEAYVKGIGRGLTFPLDVFAFELAASRLIAFRALMDFVDCDWQFHQFDMGEQHCGAVAVQGGGSRITLQDWADVFV
jgi:4'-phosphopantetheinyl transferase